MIHKTIKLIMILLLMPVWALAEDVVHGVVAVGDVIRATDHEGHYLDDGFKYKVLSVSSDGVGTVEVCSCTLTGEVTVPGNVYCSKDPVCTDFQVAHLGRGYNANITKLVLPEGMYDTTYQGTGYQNWQYCDLTSKSELEELVIPSTMKNIRFSEDNGWPYNLRKITISEDNPTIKVIQSAENSLIVVEKSTNRIQAITTKDINGDDITSLTIPEGITGFTTAYTARVLCGGPNSPHLNYNKIETLNLPSTFVQTGANISQAIASMRNLKTVVVANNNPTFCSYNGVLYYKKIAEKAWGSILYAVPGAWNPNTDGSNDVTYSTPEGVSELAVYSIFYNKSVKHIVINDTEAGGVKVNTNFAYYPYALLDITLPACAKFTDLMYCSNSLQNITISEETHEHTPTSASVDGILYSADTTRVILCPAKHTFENGLYKAPDATRTVANSAFMSCTNLTSLDLNKITSIGNNGFRSTKLTSVDLKNVTAVGDAAFYAVSTITSINLRSVKTLASNAFSGVNKITELTIPLTCTSIGTYCFTSCPLTKLEFEGAEPESLEELQSQPNLTLSGGANFTASKVKEIILPSRINSISYGSSKESYSTFGACEKIIVGPSSRMKNFNFYSIAKQTLKEVEFRDNLTGTTDTHTIASKAFAGFKALEKVTNIPINTTELGTLSFADTPLLTAVTFANGESQLTTLSNNAFLRSGITSFAIPNGVKTLGQRIFSESTLEEVNLPKTMTSIDPLTFDGCASLKAINVAEDNAKYSSLGGMVMSKDRTEIIAFPQGKSQDGFTFLPPVVKKIGKFAFFNAQNLKSIVFPRSIESIGNKAFECCYNLTDIYLMGGASTADDNFAADAAADDAKELDTDKDHRFGDTDVSSREFLKNNVTVHYLSTTSGSTTGYFTGQETKAKETAHAVSLGEGRATGQYYITNEEGKGMTAMFVGAGGDYVANVSKTYVVPATVKIGDETYKVNRIADFAFEGQTEIPAAYEEVVLRGDSYDYIGAKLFSSTTKVKSVFYAPESGSRKTGSLCQKTSRYEYSLSEGYNSIPDGITCYVPKSEYTDWQTFYSDDPTKNLPTFAKNLEYQIPMPAISTTFGTISREFDIDLSDEVDGVQQNWLESLEHPRIVAFTGMLEYMDYINENNEEVFGIRMRSINCGGEGDGTYIPANTGVLIRAYCDDDATRKEVTTDVASPEGFYYRIGEKNITPDLGYNIMACVTETSRTISPTEDGTYTNYIISKGKYYALEGDVTIPAHKSYMHINTGSATGSAKGIKLLFDDDEEASIRPVQAVSAESNAIYDIYGRRLNQAPKSGLYIINGKKTYKR